MKTCVECGSEIKGNHVEWGNRKYCSNRCRSRQTQRTTDAWRKEDRKQHPKEYAEESRRKNLKRNYDLTPEQYDFLLEAQAGVCAVCKKPETKARTASEGLINTFYLSVDHDHTSKKFRGLLCNDCNRGIGLLGDSLELLKAAVDYLTPDMRVQVI